MSKKFVSRIPLVPPGLGKPSTHSRNKRRRLKKCYEKETLLAGTSGPPKGSSLTNNLPLGQRKSIPEPSSHTPSHKNPLLSAKSPTQLSSNSLDTSLDNNRTRRDPEGPDSEVASTLNNNFEMNAQGEDISTFSFTASFLSIRDTKTF